MCLPFLYLGHYQKFNCWGDGGGGETRLPPVLLDGGIACMFLSVPSTSLGAPLRGAPCPGGPVASRTAVPDHVLKAVLHGAIAVSWYQTERPHSCIKVSKSGGLAWALRPIPRYSY